MDRRGTDNAASLALLYHDAGGLLAAKKKAFETHVQGQIPVFFGNFEEGSPTSGIGVVDQDIEAVKTGDEGGEHCFHLCSVGYISLKEVGFSSLIPDQFQGPVGIGISFQIIDAHITACLSQSKGNAATDIAASTSDESLFPLSDIVRSPFWRSSTKLLFANLQISIYTKNGAMR